MFVGENTLLPTCYCTGTWRCLAPVEKLQNLSVTLSQYVISKGIHHDWIGYHFICNPQQSCNGYSFIWITWHLYRSINVLTYRWRKPLPIIVAKTLKLRVKVSDVPVCFPSFGIKVTKTAKKTKPKTLPLYPNSRESRAESIKRCVFLDNKMLHVGPHETSFPRCGFCW